MVTDVTRKYRDIFCYALLGVAALYFIGALSLLFKSSGGANFSVKAALVGTNFEAPVPVICLVVAVLLATRFAELSDNARIVVLTALGIAGLDLLFGVIVFFAQLGADVNDGFSEVLFGFSGVPFAGKIVGVILGLAQLLFLATAAFFFFTSFQSLPAPVAAQTQVPWGADRGFGQYGAPDQYGAPGQYGGAGQQPPAQQVPGQHVHGQQTPGQTPGQPAPDQPIWRPTEPAGGAPATGWAQPGWSQPPAAPTPPAPSAGYGWAAPPEPQQAWGQPAAPPAPSAPSWPQPDPSGWGQQQGYAAPVVPEPVVPEPVTPEPAPEPDPPAPFWGAGDSGAADPVAADPVVAESVPEPALESVPVPDPEPAAWYAADPPADAGPETAADYVALAATESTADHVGEAAPETVQVPDAVPAPSPEPTPEAAPEATEAEEPPAAQGWWQHPQS